MSDFIHDSKLPETPSGAVDSAELIQENRLKQRLAELARQLLDAGELHLADEQSIRNMERLITALQKQNADLQRQLKEAKDSVALHVQVKLKEAVDEADQLRVQLAGCSVAARGGTKAPAVKGQYGWSPAYQDVLNLRLMYDDVEKYALEIHVLLNTVAPNSSRGLLIDRVKLVIDAYREARQREARQAELFQAAEQQIGSLGDQLRIAKEREAMACGHGKKFSLCAACNSTGEIPNGTDSMACRDCTGTGAKPCSECERIAQMQQAIEKYNEQLNSSEQNLSEARERISELESRLARRNEEQS